jgi:AraC-like DNA-binding protein
MHASNDRHGVLGIPPLLALARERGLDADALLAEAGIAKPLLDDPRASVPVERVHALVRLLLARTGDLALGLDAGRQYHLATFGILGAVAAVTPTAREMIRLFADYIHLTFTFFHVALEEGPARGRVVFVDDGDLGDLHRFYLDREIAFIHWAVQKFWPDRKLLDAFELDYPEPDDTERYRALCTCPVRFGAAQAAVSFDFRHDQPRADVNPLGTALLTEHLRSFGRAREGDDAVDRVRREITLAVARRQTLPELDVVAAALGLSERALRRRLSAASTSFRELADGVLAALAMRYLRDTALSVADVAERLGYSEPASFVRAFRRWTGTTPEAFRSGTFVVGSGYPRSS